MDNGNRRSLITYFRIDEGNANRSGLVKEDTFRILNINIRSNSCDSRIRDREDILAYVKFVIMIVIKKS